MVLSRLSAFAATDPKRPRANPVTKPLGGCPTRAAGPLEINRFRRINALVGEGTSEKGMAPRAQIG